MENMPEVRQVNLTIDEIKKYVCPEATDQEAYFFLQLCKAQNLNPFLREAYLIKYGKEKATIVTGKDTFTKRADRISQYDGFKAGIIVLSNNTVAYREGSFMVAGEKLLGGWAEVFRKDRAQSFRNEVSLTEYERHKQDGSLMSNWKNMPATMIRKVALVQSLREAFPDEFGGIYSPEEMPIDTASLPTYTMGQAPSIPPPSNGGKAPVQQPQEKKEAGKEPQKQLTPRVITEPQRKRFFAIAKGTGAHDDHIKEWVFREYGFESTKDITEDVYDEMCQRVKDELSVKEPGSEG